MVVMDTVGSVRGERPRMSGGGKWKVEILYSHIILAAHLLEKECCAVAEGFRPEPLKILSPVATRLLRTVIAGLGIYA